MKRSLKQFISLTTLLFAGVMVLALLDGCSSSQTTSGSQEIAKPTPPPEPPPPPKQEEMAPQAAAAPTEDPLAWVADLADVHFDYDKATIRKSEYDKLATAAKALTADGKRKVVVEGHCDERGTASYNMALGERRAKAVKHYLADLGVAGAQIQTTSFGKERPLCTEANEGCYQRNRRGHFTAQ